MPPNIGSSWSGERNQSWLNDIILQKSRVAWRERWEQSGIYQFVPESDRPKHYALTMLPYPSGYLHPGHIWAMGPSDTRARYMRMRGYNVFFPMGFDAFGLPAENAAIKFNIHPKTSTYQQHQSYPRAVQDHRL